MELARLHFVFSEPHQSAPHHVKLTLAPCAVFYLKL